MSDIFFGPGAIWFGIPAVVGTAFFTLRLALMLIGGDSDADMSGDVEFDAAVVDSVGESGEAGDSDAAFKVLSLQAVSAFLMGFGWGGIGAFRGSGLPLLVSGLIGLVTGAAMMWLLGTLLRFVSRLQSSGTVPMYHALEAEGTVYAQIPTSGAGSGEVRVVIGDRERYYKAVTDGAAIPTGAKIRVTAINKDENSVTVEEV